MKLWLLQAKTDLGNSPWNPWEDKIFGFVVRAESESDARQIADEHGGNETTATMRPWLNVQYSTCVELLAEGKAEIILEDFSGG